MKCLIYGLVDPRTLLVRYVGSSRKGLHRPRQHRLSWCLRESNYKAHWVRMLLAAGHDYEIVVLESDPVDLAAAERFWIAYGRASGWPLTNLTAGGEGTIGVIRSPETRARMAAAQRGKKRSAESIARQFASRKGYSPSLETRAKMRASNLGKKRPSSVGLAVAESNRRRAKEWLK